MNRPIPEITATTTEAKRTAAGPQLSRHCADNAFLLMDAATRVTVVVQEGLHREYSTIFPSPLRPAPGWNSLAGGDWAMIRGPNADHEEKIGWPFSTTFSVAAIW